MFWRTGLIQSTNSSHVICLWRNVKRWSLSRKTVTQSILTLLFSNSIFVIAPAPRTFCVAAIFGLLFTNLFESNQIFSRNLVMFDYLFNAAWWRTSAEKKLFFVVARFFFLFFFEACFCSNFSLRFFACFAFRNCFVTFFE